MLPTMSRRLGLLKAYLNDYVFIVYHCDNNWDNYQNYTAAKTRKCDLQKGWIIENEQN